MINGLDERRIFKDLAHKVIAQAPLLDDEIQLIARAFTQTGDGGDANRAFGVEYDGGAK